MLAEKKKVHAHMQLIYERLLYFPACLANAVWASPSDGSTEISAPIWRIAIFSLSLSSLFLF